MIEQAYAYLDSGDSRMLATAKEAHAAEHSVESCQVLAAAYHFNGQITDYIDTYREALAMESKTDAQFEIGAAFYEGRWAEGWNLVSSLPPDPYFAHLPVWDGEDVPELSVCGEGGFGDHINYARFLSTIEHLRGVKCTLYLEGKRYFNTFLALCNGQPWLKNIKHIKDAPANVPAVGLFRLGSFLDRIPPPAPWQSIAKRSMRSDKYLFALNATTENERRDMPMMRPGIYRSMSSEQVKWLMAETKDVVNWVGFERGGSWASYASIIDAADGVVSIDSGPVHLAASMGKPAFMLMSGNAELRWGGDETTTPWYPDLQLCRSHSLGYDEAVEKLIQDLHQ